MLLWHQNAKDGVHIPNMLSVTLSLAIQMPIWGLLCLITCCVQVYHKTVRKGEHEIESPARRGIKASSPGFKPLIIERASDGFGFSFRNCPPGYRIENLFMDEEIGNERGEPQSIIFVSYIQEGGPASQAGLCIGDSIICVNGKSVLGKTCSQVATLIQNCSILELTIAPNKEDTLNLIYPQDAFRNGNTHASPVPL